VNSNNYNPHTYYQYQSAETFDANMSIRSTRHCKTRGAFGPPVLNIQEEMHQD